MRRHDTDVTSLVFGLLLLGVAVLWALVQGDLLSLPDASVAGPVVLVGAGVIGLAVTLSGSARQRRREAATAYDRAQSEQPPDLPAPPAEGSTTAPPA